MSVLGRKRIMSALKEEDADNRLFISPMLDNRQIGDASVDVRLGHNFLTIKRGNLGAIDPRQKQSAPDRFRTRHQLDRGEAFFLHPNEMALASTLEYVRLPRTMSSYVTSRSKWGRLGLIIATATAVHPGFTGTITLELVNHGNVPLVLYPGLIVAQLILYEADGATPYQGELGLQTDLHPADISRDWQSDIHFWLPEI